MVDEGDQDLLSGDARETKAVGGFSLPDVEGSVLGRERSTVRRVRAARVRPMVTGSVGAAATDEANGASAVYARKRSASALMRSALLIVVPPSASHISMSVLPLQYIRR
ncbi:hypothetical protein I547_0821 [Mycobacterium kansasii 824]|nr:hypothetical protein I547_0821 [Mycobacterium kansasii 824]